MLSELTLAALRFRTCKLRHRNPPILSFIFQLRPVGNTPSIWMGEHFVTVDLRPILGRLSVYELQTNEYGEMVQ